ncbi:Stp1/IreP family PP2C-type Ser/Thr phosphatase [Amphibacillus indicireducens]|uniref:Protein-serine/threonine phosphatase PrpC n=1 Tax=Amphibacillus indicireducens TaxID=1076330 RepID=A0ABP7VAX5_9BACI
MKQFFITDCGKVRKQNEDAVGLFENRANQTLAVVADGMGGHKAGDVASEIARSYFSDQWQATDKLTSAEEAEEWLDDRIRLANQKVYRYAKENPDCQGMGTTVIAAIFLEDEISIAHIGDSRCYLLTDELKQVTEDHSLVNELVRAGEITKKEAIVHPRKNVLMKALGTDNSIAPDVFTIEWQEGNRFLICSDGLSDKLSNNELFNFLTEDLTVEEIAGNLVDRANELGGEDNITVVLVEYIKREAGDSSC